MTTNFERSKAMCRSMSGRVPLPIEPKPIITIGPSNRAWSGQLSVTEAGAFISTAPEAKVTGSRCARGERRLVAGEARDEGGEVGLLPAPTGGADQSARAVERARLELAREQPVRLIGPGQPQGCGLLVGEAEPSVIGRVADQEHGAMAETDRFTQRGLDERRADAALATVGRNRERPQQQRGPARTRR